MFMAVLTNSGGGLAGSDGTCERSVFAVTEWSKEGTETDVTVSVISKGKSACETLWIQGP